MTDITASEAFDLYRNALDSDLLIQSVWHREQDGRQLACGLGVLGPDINGPRDCPATVMPRWLAQMVPRFFDRQTFADAKAWGLAFYQQLERLDGAVPFSVVHDWHCSTVCPLAIDVATERGRDIAPHVALQNLHLRALAGEIVAATEWHPVLKNAYANAYANANANAYNAYAYAYADADAFADANSAYAYAYAYANADANAYAWKRIADGMVDALARADSATDERN
jgi:hypothetical protein